MVFVSKEPELFSNRVTVNLLIDGEIVNSSSCSPEEIIEAETRLVGDTIYSFVSYLLRHAPVVRHTDVVRTRKAIRARRHSNIHETVSLHLNTIRRHLPKGKLLHAGHRKFRHIEQLIEYMIKETVKG